MEKICVKQQSKEWNILKENRNIYIKGAVLEKGQIEDYLEKIASDHVLKGYSDKDTYPIFRVKENFEAITEVYNLLNEQIKRKIPIHPAGEWILDNYYVIERTVKNILKELSEKKYCKFAGIASGPYSGFARVYVLACEIVAYTDATINRSNLYQLLEAYQRKKELSMEEIWSISIFLNIALIENIRRISEKIYSAQIQKIRVEEILEKTIGFDSEEKRDINQIGYRKKLVKEDELKYSFIEYLSYRLRKYGKKAYPYINSLEEITNKLGTDVATVIKKEHFEVALNKVSMGNSITSMKTIQRVNFLEIFEKLNSVEDILKKDPASVYEKMDFQTKEWYRNVIKKIAQKNHVSEIYLAKKALELARREICEEEKRHIGYYLIDDGINELLEKIKGQKIKRISKKNKVRIYIGTLSIISVLCSFFISLIYFKTMNANYLFSILFGIFCFPIFLYATKLIGQYILAKIIKPRSIPKLDFQRGIPKEYSTIVVIPTILDKPEKVEQFFQKLEVFYLANKSENIYFGLLGDCTSSTKQRETIDDEIIKKGLKEVERLNKKYMAGDEEKFFFFYRNRIWCDGEECFLGWERKRGLLTQFNEFLVTGNQTDFTCISTAKEERPNIKYVITLDADTDLVLDTGLELIGAMAHILNHPKLNQEKTVVIKGHAIVQPRIGIDLEASIKSGFTKIFAGSGGVDSYTNAISDVYQDNFQEGIYTGKGIYDLKTFYQVLEGKIPENTVLSHDLLEGSYLRCALASDILLMDGYPKNYLSFKTRATRWLRGDFQIIGWLKNKVADEKGNKVKNPLNLLSKFKIFDNLVRGIQPIFFLVIFIYLIFLEIFFYISNLGYYIFFLGLVILPSILDLFDFSVYRKDGPKNRKKFTDCYGSIKASIYRAGFEIGVLPDKAWENLKAISKTIYRMTKQKKHLLEWTTAEEAERVCKTDLKSYYMSMIANLVNGIVFLVLGLWVKNIFFIVLGIVWLAMPGINYYLGKETIQKSKLDLLNKEEKEHLIEVYKRTWQFFRDNLNEKGNYLPPDNYQEDRKEKYAYRTSPTNIGLAFLAVMSSYDLKLENVFYVLDIYEKMFESIEKLPKWNGHLYNWYQIEDLRPLAPRYISSVDSGNFVGYLYVVKSFLNSLKDNYPEQNDRIERLLNQVNTFITNTDFSCLYSKENRLFSIGYDLEENKLTDSYYDLLASEARQASLIAIAKKDIPQKHWQNLSKTLTVLDKYKGLISWSGTSFEYLMPNINIPKYPLSLLDESCKFMVMSQQKYAEKVGIPWGISEAAFHLKDLYNNYQYKAFGIPWLGLKRGLSDEMVVSSYGSILAITDYPKEVVKNLKHLQECGMFQKYGYYESIDFTPTRLRKNKSYELVKTYMAHHQGLILLSIANLFCSNIIQKRMMANPEIQSVKILLQERMPENIVITKEEKEKVEKIKPIDYDAYTERVYTKINTAKAISNVVANQNYTIVTNQNGTGYSKYKEIYVNRYKQTDDENQGIFFFLKNEKNKMIWSSAILPGFHEPDKLKITFLPDGNKFLRTDRNIETTLKTGIDPNEPIEIRRIEIKNLSNQEETIEATGFLEPVLSIKQQDYAHKAFNNLFMRYHYDEEFECLIVERKARQENEKSIKLATMFFTEADCIGKMEYEIDKDRFLGRGQIGIPKAIKETERFTNTIDYTVNPVIAMKKTISIKPQETVYLDFVIYVEETEYFHIDKLSKYRNSDYIQKQFELSRAKTEAENLYLGIKGNDLNRYQRMLSYLQNSVVIKNSEKFNHLIIAENEKLWKYGISGDVPILLAKISQINDIDVINDLLKAYEYYRLKNIAIELVILNEEKEIYEGYVKDAILNAISNRNLLYLQNQKNGIILLNNIQDKEEKIVLEYRANFIVDCHLGELEEQLKELEENLKEINNYAEKENEKIEYEKKEDIIEKQKQKLLYNNEYGGFSEDGKEYKMQVSREKRTPTVWSHILANEKFGTILTESMGGYTYYKNSRLNRLTAWNNGPVTDVPSEVIYFVDEENKTKWSMGLNPMPDEREYKITYGLGYAKYEHESFGLKQDLTIFVPEKDSIKVQKLVLKNTEPKKREIKIVYYIKPVLGEDEINSLGYINLSYDKKKKAIFFTNQINKDWNQIGYIACSEEIKSYTGDRKEFFGNGNLANPNGLNKIYLNRENSLFKEARIAIEISVQIEAFEEKEVILLLGCEEEKEKVDKNIDYYTRLDVYQEELRKVKYYWEDLIGRVQIKTPSKSMNILLNGWCMYQTIVSRMFARSGYYQSGGAYGFRDQLQDSLAIIYLDQEKTKNQIIKHASHQFEEGDVEHWWHEESRKRN